MPLASLRCEGYCTLAVTELDRWREGGADFLHRGHRVFFRSDPGTSADGALPLLLIHGFPTASWDWHRVWEPLRARFSRVVAPDLIGFGFSAKPRPYDYSILDQADLCEELLGHLGVREAHVLAHDYGDSVAQEILARQARGREPAIRSMCLLNGGLFPETHRARTVQKLLASPVGPLVSALATERGFARSLGSLFGAATKPTADELHDFWTLARREGGTRISHLLIGYMEERRRHRERWVGALVHAKVPLRVIDGSADPVSGAHMVARYRELVPNPDAVELPLIGHYPQVEAPAEVVRHFLAFHDEVAR